MRIVRRWFWIVSELVWSPNEQFGIVRSTLRIDKEQLGIPKHSRRIVSETSSIVSCWWRTQNGSSCIARERLTIPRRPLYFVSCTFSIPREQFGIRKVRRKMQNVQLDIQRVTFWIQNRRRGIVSRSFTISSCLFSILRDRLAFPGARRASPKRWPAKVRRRERTSGSRPGLLGGWREVPGRSFSLPSWTQSEARPKFRARTAEIDVWGSIG
jgi:hypothetical protein